MIQSKFVFEFLFIHMSNVHQHTFNFQISNISKRRRVVTFVLQCISFTKSERKIKEIEGAVLFFQSRQLLGN